MSAKQPHKKHADLARRQLGNFAPAEYAFVGTNCGRIEQIVTELAETLRADYRLAWIDADHGEPTPHWTQARAEQRTVHFDRDWNEYDDRLLNQAADLALVNGNHYPAARQIIFIDPKKEGSLQRRREQLTDIRAVVRTDIDTPVYHWLADLLPAEVPILGREEAVPALADLIRRQLPAAPPLKALVLAGGQSQRMGQDKTQLDYHGQPQVYHVAELCRQIGLEPHVSCRPGQQETFAELPPIVDRFAGMGPFGGICSALLQDPDAAWLVLACDLPFVDEALLRALVAARDPRRYATAVRDAEKPFPEPLIAIYEPRAYQRLLQFLSLGYSCPRKMLINSDVATLDWADSDRLANINTPEELAAARKLLSRDAIRS
jgi:molybdenum cofactor guanylyltransferase